MPRSNMIALVDGTRYVPIRVWLETKACVLQMCGKCNQFNCMAKFALVNQTDEQIGTPVEGAGAVAVSFPEWVAATNA